MSKEKTDDVIHALKVRQWLAEWDEVKWSKEDHGAEPKRWFYQFSMKAQDLKALSGIYPRDTNRNRGAEDLGIQRRHEVARSREIKDFVKYGYPWSDLTESKRTSGDFQDLRQPGWLPTAIVVNILTDKDKRHDKQVAPGDLITVTDQENGKTAELHLPNRFTGSNWQHSSIPPIEVIDGQHRLWAFEDASLDGDFELPVVAFVGLDLRWQAYLFYTINIKPKKINASLAFDLYPLLRTQEWLTKFEGHIIYRETRAQELVDLLWASSESPWHHRINMLGEKGQGKMITQASWVRSLLASFVKSWESPATRIGGLFGSVVGRDETVLPWSRTEQAAFLIVAGQEVRNAIKDNTEADWAKALRAPVPTATSSSIQADAVLCDDPAFCGPNSLLNQDQGVRPLLQVLNDLLYVNADKLALANWGGEQRESDNDQEQVSRSIASLREKKEIVEYIQQAAASLAQFDWRSSDAPGLTDQQKTLKASFRGSGGYKELRRFILSHLSEGKDDLSEAAKKIIQLIGY